MTGLNVIEARGLCKDRVSSFLLKRSMVLDNLSLTVKQGETYGLLGPNGAGKTTTVKILLGLMKPDRGEVSVLGKTAGDHSSLKRIGFLPENPYFYSHLTGLEFLEFIARLFGLKRFEIKDRIKDLLRMVSMEADANKPMNKYSKGMLQRLGIAQSLINDPDILFWDEPMSGLDPIGRRDVREIINQLKRNGKTIFFNSHLLPDVNEVCDRVGVLVKGRLVTEEEIRNIDQGGGYRDLEDFFLAQAER